MLGGLSSGSLLLGSGAFSSARAERTVNVSVAEDDEALVGYSSEDRTVPMDLTDDDRVPLVTVTNQFAESVSVTAEIVEGAEYVGDVDDLKIPSGKSETVTGDINLESGEAVLEPGERIDISVSLDVDGTGVSAEVFGDPETRKFYIERSEKEVDGVSFNGAQQASVTGAASEYTIDLWFEGNDEKETRDWNGLNEDTISPSGNGGTPRPRLLAIRFQETDQTFYRPDCDVGQNEIPWNVDSFIKADSNGTPCKD